jgi:catechol 2,3-dioxygenase-like lactoylglutathione lyase family enzyme
LQDVIQHVRQQHITIIEGLVKRTGATGELLSIYMRDPDDNLIEIANML